MALWQRQEGAWKRTWETELESRSKSDSVRALAAGDLSGDGRPDLAVLRQNGVVVFVRHEETFATPVEYLTTLGEPHALHLGDVDGDGHDDVVLFRNGQERGVSVRLQRSGELGWEYAFRTGQIRFGTLANIDATPAQEILFIHAVTGRLHAAGLCVGEDEQAEFREPMALVGIPRRTNRGMAIGDVDGDGRADLLLTDPERATLEVFLQSPAGHLLAPSTFSTYAGVTDVLIADGAVTVVSSAEKVVGTSRWTEGRLPFPQALPDLRGTPRCAGAAEFGLAWAFEEDRQWRLAIGGQTVDLPRMPEGPARLLAADLDADGHSELVITQTRDPMIVVRRTQDGWSALTVEQYGGQGLVAGAAEGSFASVPSGLLMAKESFARIVGLDAGGRLVVRDQIPGPPGAQVRAAAQIAPDEAVLYDAARGQERLLILRAEGGTWVRAAALPADAVRPNRIAVADVTGDGAPDLVLQGDQALGVVRRTRQRIELATRWVYESESHEPQLASITTGDANADGTPDVLIFDTKNRTMEILTAGAAQVERALAFEVCESQEARRGLSIREWLVEDFTNDAKSDVLFLIDDRVIVYVQE